MGRKTKLRCIVNSHMIDGDLESTRILLEELLGDISGQGKKNMFTRFVDEIEAEITGLNEEYSRWKQLISSNASFKEIITNAELRQYILRAQGMMVKVDKH